MILKDGWAEFSGDVYFNDTFKVVYSRPKRGWRLQLQTAFLVENDAVMGAGTFDSAESAMDYADKLVKDREDNSWLKTNSTFI